MKKKGEKKKACPVLIELQMRNDSHTKEIMQMRSTIPFFTQHECLTPSTKRECTNKQRATGSYP